MIRLPRLASAVPHTTAAPKGPLTTRAKVLWTCGNLLMLIGVVVLLYVGGIYANEEYGRYAARGDTDVPAQPAVMETESSEPAPFVAPLLNMGGSTEGPVSSPIPSADQIANRPSVTRIMIPSIEVDAKVVEVGWEEVEQKGQKVAVWQVAKYAVGQHLGSANPGDGGNVVLAGHVGGYGKVFKDLYYVKPGDQITLYSNGQQYLYVVSELLVVTEEGVSPEQQAENALLISPTDHEQVTLITCWPATGPKRYSQRVVVKAMPFAAAYTQTHNSESSWSIR
ncbi:MAG TPA: sortase [Roseiflexaceae bacterium]|nr:sortase [Roseiflexaceae bacterium]